MRIKAHRQLIEQVFMQHLMQFDSVKLHICLSEPDIASQSPPQGIMQPAPDPRVHVCMQVVLPLGRKAGPAVQEAPEPFKVIPLPGEDVTAAPVAPASDAGGGGSSSSTTSATPDSAASGLLAPPCNLILVLLHVTASSRHAMSA